MAQSGAFKKKWENYWYYYKIHTIVGIFVLLAVAVTVSQCAATVTPDAGVILAVKDVYLTSDQTDTLSKALSSQTADVNKDGRRLVSVDSINLSDSNAQTQSTYEMKLMALLSAGDDLVIIADDAEYQVLKKEDILSKLGDVLPGVKGADDYRIAVSDLPGLKSADLGGQQQKLYLMLRRYKGTTAEKSSNQKNYENSLRIVRNLLK